MGFLDNMLRAGHGVGSPDFFKIAAKQAKGAPGASNALGMAPEELMEEAYKLLAKDRARLSGTNYPAYKGATVSPMSALTQRANDLKSQFNQKPSPYSNKISTVLNRNNEGITPQNIQEILESISSGQREFGKGPMLDILKKQFLSSFDPREHRFKYKTEKDIGRYLPEAESKLNDLSKVSSTLEGSRNQQIAKTFQGLQAEKQDRRQALVGNLEQFGNQRHAYNNMVNAANKGQFQRESTEPYRKMQMLEESLRPFGDMSEAHPDLAKTNASQVIQALRAYGVDPSKPANEWSKKSDAPYPGQLVANLPPEILASGETLGELSPKLRDQYTDKRKELTRGLLNNENLSAQALRNLPQATQAQIAALEREAKNRMKKELGTFNNEFIKLGQYDSPQHIAQAEERARTINKSVLEQRDRLIQNSLKEQLQFQHSGDINNIRQLGMIGSQSHKEYGDLLNTLRNVNKQGATKFSNDQAENEELYKNFQNEKGWEFPHMRGNIRQDAFGEMFKGLADKNISLDNLANLNVNYSNIEKERNSYQDQVKTLQQAQAQLQRQLGLQQANYQAQAQAQAAASQRQQAAAATERQRLAALSNNPYSGTSQEQLNWLKQNYYDRFADRSKPYWTQAYKEAQKFPNEDIHKNIDTIFSKIGYNLPPNWEDTLHKSYPNILTTAKSLYK